MADKALEKLYKAIVKAETGSFKNPWIRTTHAPEGGSTAFGPAQLTRTTALDFLNRGLIREENQPFLKEVMFPMYDKFNKYGNEPNVEGYDPAYDYGGTGNFDPKYQEQYNALAKDVLEDMQKKTPKGTIQRWRGKSPEQDPRYFKEALDYLNQ